MGIGEGRQEGRSTQRTGRKEEGNGGVGGEYPGEEGRGRKGTRRAGEGEGMVVGEVPIEQVRACSRGDAPLSPQNHRHIYYERL